MARPGPVGLYLPPRWNIPRPVFPDLFAAAFGSVLRPRTELVLDNKVTPNYSRRVEFQVHITNVFTEMLYGPLNRYIVNASRFMKELQTGSVQLYIGYITVVTILVLIWSTRW